MSPKRLTTTKAVLYKSFAVLAGMCHRKLKRLEKAELARLTAAWAAQGKGSK